MEKYSICAGAWKQSLVRSSFYEKRKLYIFGTTPVPDENAASRVVITFRANTKTKKSFFFFRRPLQPRHSEAQDFWQLSWQNERTANHLFLSALSFFLSFISPRIRTSECCLLPPRYYKNAANQTARCFFLLTTSPPPPPSSSSFSVIRELQR